MEGGREGGREEEREGERSKRVPQFSLVLCEDSEVICQFLLHHSKPQPRPPSAQYCPEGEYKH